jgi:signal transduction histidine kinase
LSAVRAELDAVIAEVRRFITAEENGNKTADLSGVLHALAQRVRTGTTAQIEAYCDAEASDRLSGTQAVQLANIAREALSNSLRHGKPRRVEIALRSEPESVRLEISDDGSGFDPKSATRQGVGLTSMATRAKEMRGTLDIQSAPGSGARVIIRVPASPAEGDGAASNAAESAET